MRVRDLTGDVSLDDASESAPSWLLVYATVDQRLDEVLLGVRARFPTAAVFGCTSFQGVFGPHGWARGAHALSATADEGIRAAPAIRASNPARARGDARAAAHEIAGALGRAPDTILLHATPGFEERILEGIDEAFDGRPPPVYGGSAADDDLSGKWQVFAGTQQEREGFVIVGFASDQPVHGSFVAGYLPGKVKGRVTAASGRRIRSIDGKPAARVYDTWLGGALGDLLAKGGNVLSRTTLHPLGRVVDKVGAMPRYVLGHPHEVHPDGSMSLFTEVAVGDELVLMMGSDAALVERTDQVAARAGRHATALRGGILVYCAGCVLAIGDKAQDVGRRFHDRIGGVPYLGSATFGEQGCFVGEKRENRHGNLMADAILFG